MTKTLTATQQARGWYVADGPFLTAANSAPVEVIRQLHKYAVINRYDFPLTLEINPQDKPTFYLSLSHTGAAKPAPAPAQNSNTDDTADAETETPAPQPHHEPAASAQQAPASLVASDTDDEPASAPKTSSSRKMTLVGLSMAAALLIGGGLAFMALNHEGQDSEKATAAETTPSAEQTGLYDVPSSQKPVAMAGDALIASEAGKLAITNVTTGQSVLDKPFEVSEDQLRTQTSDKTTAIDGGKGKVLFINDGKQQVVDGVLSTRGTAPVAVSKDFKHYTQPEGKEKDAPKGAVVLGATSQGVMYVKAPAKIEYSHNKHTAEVEPPEKNAKLAAWVAGTEDRAVTVWEHDKKAWLVVTDTTGNGKTVLKQEVPAVDAVTYSDEHVIVDEKKYLDRDKLRDLCANGKWIDGHRWCEANGTWTSDGGEKSPTEPQIITKKYTVSENKVEEK